MRKRKYDMRYFNFDNRYVKPVQKPPQVFIEKICKHFGCGRKLTATENLYSEYCFKHARQKNQEKEL